MLHVVDHVLLAHRLAELRDAATTSARFRRLLAEIGAILTLEATRGLPERMARITTPLTEMDHRMLAAPEPVLVAVLRAGLGLMEGGMQILPEAPVGHVGLVRDEHTLRPSQYMLRMPPEVRTRGAILFDPMLATGGSAVAAVQRVKEAGAPHLRFICVVAAPEGVARLEEAHPDVPIYTAALDERLDHRGFIVPGLGDAGDRCFGTVE
ncbi:MULTISPECIES: uracil phosphoribosyltransferase [Roseomonadaceae]|uniref:Uracil phosphoribosyltransferase n=1 Tax=Falsiroseomonas oleicola TaxID=2801474 RepID=A0ABS6H850_9PROT|nr:uracil phosphoribosyltransferase [Roseomonas oleicola]MBU8544882.1 uracil phosphoribosyltransferase [Roseomonas oleicola]